MNNDLNETIITSKEILRKKLFDKYFELENGILAIDLVDKLSFVPEVWKRLHTLCIQNIKFFDAFSTLEKLKLVDHRHKKYMILKSRMFKYVIVDIEKMENITEEQFRSEFDEKLFIDHFDEIKRNEDLFGMYDLMHYDGNVEELVDFYYENQETLCLSTELYYRLEVENAWTYFYIDFANASAQMSFQTKDQFLYEQLFLRYDLMPSRNQDACDRIGADNMKKMFDKIHRLKIPKQVVPDDLYQQYLIQSHPKSRNVKVKSISS